MLQTALYDDAGKLVMRLMLGGLMLFHGIAKLGDGGALNWIAGQLSNLGLPGFIAYGVFVGEIVAPVMIIAGVYCRIGAALLIVNMLFAIGLVHLTELFMINEQGGYALELHAFYTFTALAIALTGSGRFAVKPD